MNVIREAEELIEIGKGMSIDIKLLEQNDAEKIIRTTLEKFTPFKLTGHLGIGNDSIELPIDKWEFSYMDYLPEEKGYIFFEQTNDLKRKTVIEIGNIRLLGKILENSSGVEYFLTNQKADFLIAANWYFVEIAGDIKEGMIHLLN